MNQPFEQRLPAAVHHWAQDRVRAELATDQAAALLTDDPEDVAYLTGFFHHPCERPVAAYLEGQRCVLLVPELEREHAADQHVVAEVVAYPEFPGVRSPWAYLRDAVGIPPEVRCNPQLSLERAGELAAELPAHWAPSSAVRRARLTKHPQEIVLHREAGRIADLMVAAGVELIRERVGAAQQLPSEQELAAHVGRVGAGIIADEHQNPVTGGFVAGGLVYSGTNSVRPHAPPGPRRLRRGETFMLSLGAAVGGRFIECERTFVLGRPDPDQRRFHDAVREAQRVGAQLVPGMTCADSNARCLGVLHDAGLSRYLRHRQGHGIGLGMHEPPWLEDGDPTRLAPGMIVSNEPGIYVGGHAGYRISDSMLITATGAESLTHYPRDLDACTIDS